MHKLIPLSQGKFAKVDEADYEYLSQWKWFVRQGRHTYYASTYSEENGSLKQVHMHNLILGTTPIDHKDGDGLNNQRQNLRPCTQSQNFANTTSRPGTSKYKGVCFYHRTGRWRATIQVDGRKCHLGYFDDEDQAATAYNRAALNVFGEFARLNSVGVQNVSY